MFRCILSIICNLGFIRVDIISCSNDLSTFGYVVVFQESVGVLVDSSEVQNGGNLVSRLRLHYGAQTAVVSLKHAHYAVSTRMAVARLSLSGKAM